MNIDTGGCWPAQILRRAALLALATGAGLFAQPLDSTAATTRVRPGRVFTLYLENDTFTGTDEQYTSGLKFSWFSGDLVDWGQTGWRKRFVELLPFVNRTDGQKNIGFAIGQNIYTPRNIEAVVPDSGDRPYAGWSYLELTFVSKTTAVADIFSIQAGVIGPHSLAEDTQRLVHQWTGNTRPMGWDYQLRDEVGVNLVYERRWRFFHRSLFETFGVDFVPHAGASLGNVQTYANTGATVRLGLNLPSDFGVELVRPGGVGGTPADDRDPRVAPDRNFSVFGFGTVDGRAVARDIFLDGNTFRASRSVRKEPFMTDFSVGIGMIFDRWQCTYTQVWRTREFKAQRSRYNNFGSATLSRAF